MLALIVAMSAFFTVAGLSIVAAESLESSETAAAEFALAITIAAALTLVSVMGMRSTRTENGNPYNLPPVNAYHLGKSLTPWQAASDLICVRYCDRCGNRL